MKKLVALVVAIACASCAAPNNRASIVPLANKVGIPEDAPLVVKIEGDKHVRFLGYTDFDEAGTKGNGPMYPADNAAVFLVAVLAHSATTSSINNSEKQRLQDQADQVLTPYRQSIENVTTDKLIENGIRIEPQIGALRLAAYEESKQQDGWVIESSPVYFLTQDQTSIILQNPIIIYEKSKATQPHYRNLIEIVFPLPQTDKAKTNLADQGQLTNISSNLFSESLRLSIQDAQQQLAGNGAQKTFYYYLGKKKIFERGELAHADCERITIRTLHGWLKSVPIPSESTSEISNCSNAENEQHKPESI